MKLRKLSIVLILSLLMTTMPAFAADTSNTDIVAIVNDRVITLDEFYATMEREVGSFVLAQMIFRELVRQKQKALGITVDPQEMEAYLTENLADAIRQLGGEANFYAYLEERRMTQEVFLELMELEYTLYLCALQETTVTPDQVAQFYEENKDYFSRPEMVRASHILVATEAEADQLLAQLKAGANFADLAKTYSTDTGTGVAGGDLGYFAKGEMVPEFEQLCWSLDINQVGKVKTYFGWHVVKVTDKIAPYQASLENDYADIEDTMIRFIASEYLGHYLYRLEQETNIQILREGFR